MSKVEFRVSNKNEEITTGLLIKDNKPYAHAHFYNDSSLGLWIAFPILEGFDYDKGEIINAILEATGKVKGLPFCVTNNEAIFKREAQEHGFEVEKKKKYSINVDLSNINVSMDEDEEIAEEHIEIVNMDNVRFFSIYQTNVGESGEREYEVKVDTDAIVEISEELIEHGSIEDLVEEAIGESAIFKFADNIKFVA